MTIITDITRGYMVRRLAQRYLSIVTGNAGAQHRAMIDRRWRPESSLMAVLAEVIAGDVIDPLAGGRCTVMAGNTIARYRIMVK